MSINRYWNTTIALFIVLLAGGFRAAAPSPQESSRRPPVSEEDRRRLLERLTAQLGESRQGAPAPESQAQQPEGEPAPAVSQKQSSLQESNGKLQLIFKDVDLTDFIRQISELLDLTPLVIDSDVQGTVTIHSSAPMSKDEVLALFHLILKTKNASLIEHDGIYQVVPIASALRTGVDLIKHPPPDTDTKTGADTRRPAPESPEIPDLATNVIRVEFIPVKDLIEPLKLFMTEGGVIMPYERLNMLILTDFSDSIERILKIVHMLDNHYMDPDLIDLIKIHHNASADVVEDLNKIFGNGAQDASTGISFISLDRMNAIFVMASSRRGLEEVKRWIEELDTTTGRKIQTNVYVVQNGTASNIATMLSALYGGEGTTRTSAGGENSSAAAGGGQLNRPGDAGSSIFDETSRQRGSFGSFTDTQSGSYTGGGIFSGGQQLGPRFSPSGGISSVILRSGEFSGLQDTVRLVVDDINNSLIIQSTSADYAFILETIKKMDVMPRQAIIDARVFEVDLTDDLSYGVAAALRERTNGSLTTVNFSKVDDTGAATGALLAQNVALVGNSQELLTALNALREKTNVKILESPSLLALDGSQASFTVGSEVPYPGTSYTQAVGGTTTSVQYRDTGITLYVLPRISASGSVTLQVLQEVSGVGAETELGPTFTKSQVQTTLTVKDGETVAIAGLIRDANSWVRTGFPLISDIPIIGSLFGQTSRSKTRSELIILITPHVIHNPDKFREFTGKFRDSMRNVRKFSDEKERERIEDMQEAIEDREKEKEKQLLKEQRERRRETKEETF